MELIEYLVNAKNLTVYEREPAIEDSELDELIKKYKGNKKIFEIRYQFDLPTTTKKAPVTQLQYTVGDSIDDPKVHEDYEWYVNSNLYYNVSIQEKIF